MHMVGKDPAVSCPPNASGDEATGRARNPYGARNTGSIGNPAIETPGSPVHSPVDMQLHQEVPDHGAHSVNVQPRYRLQSPPASFMSGEPSFPASPRDTALHSTPHARSCSKPIPCDGYYRQFLSGPAFSPPMGRSPDYSTDPNFAMSYPSVYAPSTFAMPPVLIPARTDMMGRLPVHDGPSRGRPKRPVSSPIACSHGSSYVSPVTLSVSPNYQVGSHTLRSPTVPQSLGFSNVLVGVGGSAEVTQVAHSRMGVGDGGSTVSGGSSSSTREHLPLCPNDGVCMLINERSHQRRYAHTCRLSPCYHGQVARHSKMFRHAPGQIAQSEELLTNGDGTKKLPAEALASVSFSSISREAPNAYRIVVTHKSKSYEIFGDWANVRVHTFKRYLNQVYNVPPPSQVLVREEGGVALADDLEFVTHYGVKLDSVVILKRKDEDESIFVAADQL